MSHRECGWGVVEISPEDKMKKFLWGETFELKVYPMIGGHQMWKILAEGIWKDGKWKILKLKDKWLKKKKKKNTKYLNSIECFGERGRSQKHFLDPTRV